MSDEPREPDDALDALARAFRELPAPAPARELQAEDEGTRRAVAWMAAAWQAQSPASSAPPAEVLARRARPAPLRVQRAWRPLAAAAAVLVLLGGAWMLAGRVLPPREATSLPAVAQGPGAEPPVPAVAPPEPAPPHIAPPVASASGVVAVAEDHLELRSGPVRMLLFLKPTTSNPENVR
ncbi:MAG TPA: hypothetical protein VFY71_03050 [Planctomycetota bacterium]|nr:hypothetical protein [Planctomycetota bacterium]